MNATGAATGDSGVGTLGSRWEEEMPVWTPG